MLDGKLGSIPCELVQVIGWGNCNQTQTKLLIHSLWCISHSLFLFISKQPAHGFMILSMILQHPDQEIKITKEERNKLTERQTKKVTDRKTTLPPPKIE